MLRSVMMSCSMMHLSLKDPLQIMSRSLKHPKLNHASFSNDGMFYDASFFKDPLQMMSRSLKHPKLNNASFSNDVMFYDASFFKDQLQMMSCSLKHPKLDNTLSKISNYHLRISLSDILSSIKNITNIA